MGCPGGCWLAWGVCPLCPTLKTFFPLSKPLAPTRVGRKPTTGPLSGPGYERRGGPGGGTEWRAGEKSER